MGLSSSAESCGCVVLAIDGRVARRALHDELAYHSCTELSRGLKQAARSMLRRPAEPSIAATSVLLEVARRAIRTDRQERYPSVRAFYVDWLRAL